MMSDPVCPDEKTALRAAMQRALHLLAEPCCGQVQLDTIKSVLLTALDAGVMDAGTTDVPLPVMNPRQRETLILLAEGLSNRLIARRMGVDEDVVKTQVRLLLDRLGMRNRTALALWAVRNGVVPMTATN